MSADRKRVFLYIFSADDGVSTDDRLRIAARRYIAAAGAAINPELHELVVARTPRGKPYFSDCPRIHISVSHSGDYLLCAVADFPVGVDIQIHTGPRDETPEEAAVRLRRIAKRYFTPGEAAFIQTDTCDRFFRLWTARESYVKYTGQGIDDSFADCCVLPDGSPTLPMNHKQDGFVGWRALEVAFRQMRLAEAYTICVCAQEDFFPEIIWMTDKISE